MQGSFVQAASPAPSCLQLAAAVLELTCSPQVMQHQQSFVRRCALVTCFQVGLAWPLHEPVHHVAPGQPDRRQAAVA